MATTVNPSEFRKGVYGYIKQVSATGDPVEIETRGGDVLQLRRVSVADRFANIIAMPELMAVDPEDLVSVDWSSEWDVDAAVSP